MDTLDFLDVVGGDFDKLALCGFPFGSSFLLANGGWIFLHNGIPLSFEKRHYSLPPISIFARDFIALLYSLSLTPLWSRIDWL